MALIGHRLSSPAKRLTALCDIGGHFLVLCETDGQIDWLSHPYAKHAMRNGRTSFGLATW